MKKLILTAVVLIVFLAKSFCQFPKIGIGLNSGSGFHYNNETADRDLYRSPFLGFYLKTVVETKTPLQITPSFIFYIPRDNKIPDIGATYKSTRTGEYQFNIDGDYLFFSPGWFDLYGLAGVNITVAKIKWEDGTFSPSVDNALGFNFGAGLNFKITDKITLNSEAKIIAGKYRQLVINAGALINFKAKKFIEQQ
jgi:opacity protein-like surface antigen